MRRCPAGSSSCSPRTTIPEETGATYYENAVAKALYGRRVGDPAAWMLGEDSGIEVVGARRAPGHQPPRAGRSDGVAALLDELRGREDRRARYVCELVALGPAGEELRGTGVLEGTIAEARRGDEGFGYDPIFVPLGESRTVAELGNAWKRTNSHRARAAAALARPRRGRRPPAPRAASRGTS